MRWLWRTTSNSAVDRWGGLDGLFNVAGTEGELKPMLKATIENYDRVMAVNREASSLA